MVVIYVFLVFLAVLFAYIFANKQRSIARRKAMTLDEFSIQFGAERNRRAVAESYKILSRLSDSNFIRSHRLHEDIGITDDDLVIEMSHFLRNFDTSDIFNSKYANDLPIRTVDDLVTLLEKIINEDA